MEGLLPQGRGGGGELAVASPRELVDLTGELPYPDDADTAAGAILGWLQQTLAAHGAVLSVEAEDGRSEEVRAGRAVEDAAAAALHIPLSVGATRVGKLVLGPRDDGRALAPTEAALAIFAGLAGALLLRFARQTERMAALSADLEAGERELADLAGRLVHAHEEERRRIALDLHDEPLQRAILLLRDLAPAREEHDRVGHWMEMTQDVVIGLRAVCNGLRPRVLDDFGLVAGLEWLVNDVRAQGDLAVYLTTASVDGGAGRLPSELELALYRVAQEALNNVLKHAHASEAHVTLWRRDRRVRLTVADNGIGFRGGGAVAGSGLGIVGMRERLRPWGGQVRVGAGHGGGTVVVAEVTLEAANDRGD